MNAPLSHAFHDRPHSCCGHVERTLERHDLVLAGVAARGDVERFADGEEADRDDDDADAVEKFGEAEGEARLAGLDVDADHAEEEAQEEGAEAPHGR